MVCQHHCAKEKASGTQNGHVLSPEKSADFQDENRVNTGYSASLTDSRLKTKDCSFPMG